MFSSRHAYFLSVESDASHRKPNITSGHKWPIPQKFYDQGPDIYRSVAPKFLLFCNRTILKAYLCCGNINKLVKSRLLLLKLKSAISPPQVSTGSYIIAAFKKPVKYYIDNITNPFSSHSCEITSTYIIYHIRGHKLWANIFCTVAPNKCGSSVRKVLHVVRLAPRIWGDS
jgi:hypothetical protein